MPGRRTTSIRNTLRQLVLAVVILAWAPWAAQAATILTIDEFTWDSSTGTANLSGGFYMDSYTGEQWRLTHVEIMVGSTVYATSLAPYTVYNSLPLTHSFEDVSIAPVPLTVGSSYQVGIRMQRYFSWMSGGWESAGTIFNSTAVVTAVPEPTTAVLMGLGLAALAARRPRL